MARFLDLPDLAELNLPPQKRNPIPSHHLTSSFKILLNRKPKEVEEEDLVKVLPIANVSRIMKRALPENAKVAKDAKECVQECVSEFIAFVSSEGNDILIFNLELAGEKCFKEKRKTINGKYFPHNPRSYFFRRGYLMGFWGSWI